MGAGQSFRAKFGQVLLLLVLRKAPMGNGRHLNATINDPSSVHITIQQAISNGKHAKFPGGRAAKLVENGATLRKIFTSRLQES
jgi:hypothetical protein